MTTLAKDFHRLLRRIDDISNSQASIEDVDETTLDRFTVVIRPIVGLYKGGTFRFKITTSDSYPSENAPAIWCDTDIYHPNINPTTEQSDEHPTNVCCNMFDTGIWDKHFGLEGVVIGLMFLMLRSNCNEIFSPYFETYPDEDEFRDKVHRYMTGQKIDGVPFNIDFGLGGEETDDECKEDAEETFEKYGDEENRPEAEEIHHGNECDTFEETGDCDACIGGLDTAVDDTGNHGEVKEGELNAGNITGKEDTEAATQCMLMEEFDIGGASNNDAENDTDKDSETEMTEEYMLKLLTERKERMYAEFVDKSVLELQCTGVTRNINLEHDVTPGTVKTTQDARRDMTDRVEDANEIPTVNETEDCINILYIDGDFVLLQADEATTGNMLNFMRERDEQMWDDIETIERSRDERV